MNYLSIDVGGTFTKYAIITDQCEIIEKGKIPTVLKPLDQVVKMLAGIYETFMGKVEGIALSMPGFVDSQTGFMYSGGSLTCVNHVNIVDLLSEYCDVPITVENDANCAAMAEAWKGALKSCRDGVVLVCGTGVGGAIIHNKELIAGSHFSAGEMSYIYTDTDKAGQFNQVFGATNGIHALIKEVALRKDIPKDELDGVKIFALANEGDEEVLTAIRDFARRFAVQINNLQFILDPECFAIGGGISAQPLFIQLIQEEVNALNKTYPWPVPCAKVAACEFTNDANLIGAVYVHLKLAKKQL